MDIKKELIESLSIVGRFSNYPLVSQWNNQADSHLWLKSIENEIKLENEFDLYLHIPFCETLCTFCGCNINVTKDHLLVEHFLSSIERETLFYSNLGRPQLKNLFLGGGTPNFLNPTELKILMNSLIKLGLYQDTQIHMELDPRFIDHDLSHFLMDYNVQNVSMGVQDFNQLVLTNVNRPQKFQQIKEALDLLREHNVKHINLDFIYGLPYQTPESLIHTMGRNWELKPDSVTLYPFFNVPWQTKGKNAFGEGKEFPAEQLVEMQLACHNTLRELSYELISFGHYVHKHSKRYQLYLNQQLSRTYMGHYPNRSEILIPLGPSAIGHTKDVLIQNTRAYPKYLSMLEHDNWPIERTHSRNEEEYNKSKLFEKLSCNITKTQSERLLLKKALSLL